MGNAARSAGGLLVFAAVAVCAVAAYVAGLSLYAKDHSALLVGLEIAHGVLWAGTAALILHQQVQEA
jgi:hypothetical protein